MILSLYFISLFTLDHRTVGLIVHCVPAWYILYCTNRVETLYLVLYMYVLVIPTFFSFLFIQLQ